MTPLLERFLRYVRIDTQSDENSTTAPSTAKQLNLSRLLAEECRSMGCVDVSLSEAGVLIATVPTTVSHQAPTIAWVAHVDTSPEYTAVNVSPLVHKNYQGEDLVLPGDNSRALRPTEFPELKTVIGHTLITTDGTTLLGADDKAGVAVILEAARELLANPAIPHGPIKLCFTCDEEIGRGTDHMDLANIAATAAYTLDGGGVGEVDVETFSADQAIITIKGINTHPSIGQGVMVNAVRILSAFLARLPQATLSPETTAGREGFIHPYQIEGGVSEATAKLILRDFKTSALTQQKELLEQIAAPLRAEFPRAEITVEVRHQYRNMGEWLDKEPRAAAFAQEAYRAIGIEPKLGHIRGGTDGSLLTAKGLPTPNLSCGQHNPHSPLEWASLDEMQTAVRLLVELAKRWGQETN